MSQSILQVYLLSQPNYYTTKFFTEYLLATEMKKKKKMHILVKKLAYLPFSILELSKILMHEIWYDYIKSKYGHKSKLCHMDTDSFIVYIKTDNIYKNIAEDLIFQWKLDLIFQIIN